MGLHGISGRVVVAAFFLSIPALAKAAYFPPVLTPTGVTASTVAVVNGASALNVTVNTALPAGSNAIGTVTAAQSTPASLKASVLIDGTSNTVQITGTPTVTASQSTAASLKASVLIDGTSNTVNAAQSGSWSVTASQATPASLKASVLIDGTSNTVQITGTPSVTSVITGSVNVSTSNVKLSDGVDIASVTTAGLLLVDGSGATQPISGTVTAAQTTATSLKASVLIDGSSNTVAAAQSGTWTVQPGNTANTTAWKVDGSAVTQPISGTVTAAQATAASLKASVLIDGTSNTVQITGTPSVAQSGTWTVQPGNTQNTTPWLAISTNTQVQGMVASSATNSGNPVKVGVVVSTSNVAKVPDQLITDLRGTSNGAILATLDCPRELIVKSSITITASTTETVILSSGAANVFNDLVEVLVLNTSVTASRIDFRSGGNGTQVDFAVYVPAGETRGKVSTHPWPQTSAASNWTAQSSASVTDIRIYGLYCKEK